MAVGTTFPAASKGILTPLGVLSRTFFEDAACAEGAALDRAGSEFFPWWEAAAGSEVAGKLARTILLTMPWHPPESDAERVTMELALACFDSFPGALAASGVDERDVAELRNLLRQKPEDATSPRATGFGFMRGPVRRHPFSSVSIVVPNKSCAPCASPLRTTTEPTEPRQAPGGRALHQANVETDDGW